MKALILAAGLGERMRPLTLQTPKPLLKAGNHALIEHHIIKLAQAGVRDIIINLSYLGEQIKAQLGDGTAFDVNITYSEEGPIPLGPGGAIVHALPLLDDEPFIVLAADIYSNFPMESLLDKTHYPAHMVMVNNPDFHHEGDYGMTNGLLTQNEPKFTYAGYSVWQPDIFKEAKDNTPIGITPFIDHTLQTHHISAELFAGYWMNVGTPEQLSELNNHLNTVHETR